ncbi:deoxynucleoside kinase-like [Ylistrum balloti]|uniref:deoxynucleoside kinase-like n=1 Tax=Ylistrum balloti TaxID=509963 RepID=UPI002905EC47|nr:deoxynucleoside kinase-like [Ylistrum balloti]
MALNTITGILANQIRRPMLAAHLMLPFGGKSLCAKRNQASRPTFFLDDTLFEKMLGSSQLKTIKGKVFEEEDITTLLPKGKKACTISVEGNIGCGKTTLLEYFKESPNVQAIREPVEQWTNVQGHNALELLYQDPKRWSFSFNLYAQLTRIQMHTCAHNKPVKMLERSLFSTRYCFVENDYINKTINGLEYAILNQWFEFLTHKKNTQLDLIVYLRADPRTCYERIKKRSRKEESGVPYELIQNLHDLHEEWLVHERVYKSPCPVLILDANKEYTHMTKLYEDNRQEILCGYI